MEEEMDGGGQGRGGEGWGGIRGGDVGESYRKC